MYIKVAPLRRLPKNLSVCDYLVPEAISSHIQVGQLVSLPFRKSKIFGLVLSIQKHSEYAQKVKPIEKIVLLDPILNENEIKMFQKIASLYNISLGILLESTLPPLQKRKLQTLELAPRPQKNKIQKITPQFFHFSNETEHAKILQKLQKKQTLILVPEIQMIERNSALYANTSYAVWHSELSTKQKFETWQKIRSGEVDTVIGTRSAIFLSFFDLQTIVIDEEEEKDHKHWDASPRFHVKDIALLVAEVHQAQVIFTSAHPTSELYYQIYQQEYEIPGKMISSHKTIGLFELPKKSQPIFINLKSEQIGHKNDYFLSHNAEQKIFESTGDVFLFLNRRGSATSIFCKMCGYKDTCPNCQSTRVYHESDKLLHCHFCKTKSPLPLLCPTCNSQILELRGYGTEQIEKILQKLNKNPKRNIVRLDSDTEEKMRPELLNGDDQKIIIGTELSLAYLNWEKISLCVCINLDSMLTLPEYTAEERLWHFIQKLQYERKPESELLIQTFNPDHAFWKTLQDSDLFYRTDLKRRKAFHFPPYGFLVRYIFSKNTLLEAKNQAEATKNILQKLLTTTEKKGIIYDPFELSPRLYRKKYWYAIIILLEPKNWMEELILLNTHISEDIKVDPRPLTLLTP